MNRNVCVASILFSFLRLLGARGHLVNGDKNSPAGGAPRAAALPTQLLRNRQNRAHLRRAIAMASLVAVGIALFAAPAARAQNLTLLYSFKGAPDGADPAADLFMDAAGNLYGTTVIGGAFGYGTVFKVDTAGNETVLHSFSGSPDGATPQGGLVMDAAGNLYGTTTYGGVANNGTVFKLDTVGSETVLHSFSGLYDGANPMADLLIDTAGNLYGTTAGGGGPDGYGTVFKIYTNGFETVLYRFSGFGDGAYPHGGLIMDTAGNLYGTTYQGGRSDSRTVFGDGTVFKLKPDFYGDLTVLYSFAGAPDGEFPNGNLIMDATGNLYGSTQSGGASGYAGTVFRIDTSGNETVLHSFSGAPDGAWANGSLAMDAVGNLYGTTFRGGLSDVGVVFKIDTSGNETVLQSLTMGTPHYGGPLSSGLVIDKARNLYGTTRGGDGAGYLGTVFKFSLGVPFSCLTGKLEIDEDNDAFELQGTFSLGPGGSIDPVADPVSLTVGPYSLTIPAGAFVKHGQLYRFEGVINGVRLDVLIRDGHCGDDAGGEDGGPKCKCSAESYRFSAKAKGVNLNGASNPVAITISIGDNAGSTQINARSE